MQMVTETLMRRFVDKASSDGAFRKQLVEDTPAALHAQGVEVPTGTTVKVVDTPGKVAFWILSEGPADDWAARMVQTKGM